MKRKVHAQTRLLHDLFTQYQSTFLAFCELINNAIQAEAKSIDITIDYPKDIELSPVAIKKMVIRDNGIGVHQNALQERLLDFGDSSKKGGKGIGRFAALQIGSKVEVKTVGFDKDTKTYSEAIIPFSEHYFKSVKNIEELEIETDEKLLNGTHKTYYQVTIEDIYDPAITGKNQKRKISERLLQDNIADAIFERYPIVIFNRTVKFRINGEELKRDDFIDGKPESIVKIFTDKKGQDHPLYFTYIKLKSTIEEIKVFLTVKNATIDTIIGGFQYEADWLGKNLSGWFVYIHSEELQTDIYRNIDIDGLDEQAADLKSFIKDTLNEYFKAKAIEYDDFVSKLKTDAYYPYKESKATSKSQVQLFEQVAFLVEEKYNLFTINKHLREIIYPLIDRTLVNGDLDKIMQKILKLHPKHLKKLNALLEKADIEDVIEFSEKVAKKVEDLAFIEKITCSALAKHVAERKELHKVVEKMLWIFGEKYLDSSRLLSDTSLENNLRELREKTMVYKASKEDDNVNTEITGKSKSIIDLFLYSEKPIDDVRREVLIVELKAPKVKISPIEFNQVKKYAREIERSTFYSDDITFHIILISSAISDAGKFEIEGIAEKPRDNPYFFFQNKNQNIIISVMRWSQLLEANKRKLNYLANQLKVKDKSVEEKIAQDFSEIGFDKIKSVLRKVAVDQ